MLRDGSVMDFTKMRMDRVIDRGVIRKCPKCGRKGCHSRDTFSSGKQLDIYIHRKTLRLGHGIGFWSVGDHCSVAVEQ